MHVDKRMQLCTQNHTSRNPPVVCFFLRLVTAGHAVCAGWWALTRGWGHVFCGGVAEKTTSRAEEDGVLSSLSGAVHACACLTKARMENKFFRGLSPVGGAS